MEANRGGRPGSPGSVTSPSARGVAQMKSGDLTCALGLGVGRRVEIDSRERQGYFGGGWGTKTQPR